MPTKPKTEETKTDKRHWASHALGNYSGTSTNGAPWPRVSRDPDSSKPSRGFNKS